MKLMLNGETIELDGELTLKELLDTQGFDAKGVAAAVNQEFVPRATYETTTLKADDDVEIRIRDRHAVRQYRHVENQAGFFSQPFRFLLLGEHQCEPGGVDER